MTDDYTPTEAELVDLYWKTSGDDWAIPEHVMVAFARAVIAQVRADAEAPLEREVQFAEDQANNLAGDLAVVTAERDALQAVIAEALEAVEAWLGARHYNRTVADIVHLGDRLGAFPSAALARVKAEARAEVIDWFEEWADRAPITLAREHFGIESQANEKGQD